LLGSSSPEKCPDRPIEIAARTGMKQKIAAKVEKADEAYGQKEIAPMIEKHKNVEYIGEINETQKADLLGNAQALLFPIDWPEPFGLVMIEAMACGTPVIAFERGSVPAAIDDNVSGFIANASEEAVEAVGKLEQPDRKTVSNTFDKRFTARRMANDYVDIYRSLVNRYNNVGQMPLHAANGNAATFAIGDTA